MEKKSYEQIEQELQIIQQKNELFERALNSAPIGIMEWNLQQNLFYCDERIFHFLGLPLNYPISTGLFLQSIHPNDKQRVKNTFDNFFQNEGNNKINIQFRVIGIITRVERWLELDGRIKTENNIPSTLTAIIKDISDKKIKENRIKENQQYLVDENEKYEILTEQLQQSITELKQTQQELEIAKEKAEESDKLKTAFLQNISHEIRTPMNAIMGFSRFLQNPNLEFEKRKAFSSIIIEKTNQLLTVFNNLLTISSVEANLETINLSKVSVKDIIFEILSVFKNQPEKQNIPVFINIQSDINCNDIYTDAEKLRQILTNLISNAFKFTHQGNIEIGFERKDGYHCFYIKDTGIGIHKDTQQIIFERFRQADFSIASKYGGTGLGLSISKSLVELLGGRIWVESEPGRGSVFHFTIPDLLIPPNYSRSISN